MQLALFDLDNTLIAGDSDYSWGEFLVRIGKVDAETYQELELYSQLYAQEYGEAIDTAALAAEILRQFLAGDRAFKTWKRRRGNGAGAASHNAEASA